MNFRANDIPLSDMLREQVAGMCITPAHASCILRFLSMSESRFQGRAKLINERKKMTLLKGLVTRSKHRVFHLEFPCTLSTIIVGRSWEINDTIGFYYLRYIYYTMFWALLNKKVTKSHEGLKVFRHWTRVSYKSPSSRFWKSLTVSRQAKL